LNCLAYRLEKGEKPTGRSYCPHCKHTLSWQDLLPVFSFIMLKGKCRYCGKKISWQYPAVEIATGLLFLLIFNFSAYGGPAAGWQFQNLGTALYLFITTSFLIIIFVYDLKHFLIPDKILFPLIGIVFLYRVFGILNLEHWNLFRISNLEFRIFDLINPLSAAIGAGIFFLTIFLISQGRWLGFGDVKLVFFMGLFLGYPEIIAALFFSFFIGAVAGTGLIFLKKKTMKSEVPFGPFLITGTFIALFWGRALIDWYSFLLK
jgi:prepilin signal peptidase PulO-like enzyme (type II secretory pathway)